MKLVAAALVSLILSSISVCQASKKRKNAVVCPSVCDLSKCPSIGPIKLSECKVKNIVFDQCGCCRRCIEVRPSNITTVRPSQTLHEEACSSIKCSKKEICILNQQGLPICRCPSESMCRQTFMKKVCGNNGVTYPSRCHLKVAKCHNDKRIKFVSIGPCGATNASTSPPQKPAVTPEHIFTPIDTLDKLQQRVDNSDNDEEFTIGMKIRKMPMKMLRRILRRESGLSPLQIEEIRTVLAAKERRRASPRRSRPLKAIGNGMNRRRRH